MNELALSLFLGYTREREREGEREREREGMRDGRV